MLSPEGEPQCNRCRKPLDISGVGERQLIFCDAVCRMEYQIGQGGFHRIDNAYVKNPGQAYTSQHISKPRIRNDTDEFRLEDVQPARWKTALWVTIAMCVAFKLATVYLQYQRGEGITFAGKVVVRPR